MQSTAELLTARFRDLYPHISISRPGRFLETVRRIAGPIRMGKLKELSHKSYLKRRWTPRTRNTVTQDPAPFPEELSSRYGLTIEILVNGFGESDAVQWCVHGIPDVGFYRMLHQFLKRWSVTQTH